jgi:mannitol/fructose-specific phosphotransferase system IIA component (Ntr-type)
MRLTRFLKPAHVKLALEARPIENPPETWSPQRIAWETKERVLRELVELLDRTGNVINAKKLLTDLTNRERKATTGIGGGLAIPHVRTMQVRKFTLAIGRAPDGIEFGALDDAPVRFFFCVVAPPYDDKLYLQIYRRIGEVFGTAETRQQLMDATDEHEIIRIVSRFDE